MVSASVTEMGRGSCTQAELIKMRRAERRAELQKHLLAQANGRGGPDAPETMQPDTEQTLQLFSTFTLMAASEYTQINLQLHS